MKLLVGIFTISFGLVFFGNMNGDSKISTLPYHDLWSQADSLKSKGLPKSALDVVYTIYAKAKIEKNLGNQTKSIFYIADLTNQTEEENDIKFYRWIQDEIKTSDPAFKAILHTLAAETLERIYSINSYRLSNRTTMEAADINDLSTWSKEDFQKYIVSHYYKSIESDLVLKSDISVLDSVVSEYSIITKKYTPSLYDFLTRRVLKHFSSNSISLTKPEDYFKILDEDYFLPGKDFSNLKIVSNDTSSYEFRIISLYQNYLNNISDRNIPALYASVDLDRLQYVYSQYDGIDKDVNYNLVLDRLLTIYTDTVSTQRILTSKAALLVKEGHKYNSDKPDSKPFRWKKKEAFDLLQNYLDSHPTVEIIYDFRQLYDQLLAHQLEVRVESVNIPKKPILLNFRFQNIDSVEIYLKKIQTKDYFIATSRRNFLDERKLQEYISNAEKLMSLPMPSSGDFQAHNTEYFLEALPPGKYEILVIGSNKYSKDKIDNFAFSSFRVSNLALLEKSTPNVEEKVYMLFDRSSGKRVAEAKIEIYSENYDARGRTMELVNSVKSNHEGEFKIDAIINKNIEVIVLKNDDVIHEPLGYSYYRGGESDLKEVRFGSVFTDRAIYRPGQTVFFKTILYRKSQNSEKYPVPLKKTKVEIILRDANGKEISRKSLTSDEFGSVYSQFNLPQGGLSGDFRIHLSEGFEGSQNIKVEEYKRPKFSVSFDKVKDAIKLGNEVKVTANAKYFSGVAAEGAAFTYRIVRKSIVPYWYRYFPSWMDQDQSIIGGGEGIVDKEGKIEIKFIAAPRYSLESTPKQFYNYEINVDVIDINGETRSNILQVPVSSIEKFIDAKVDRVIFQKNLSESKVIINSKNIQEQPLPALISVSVEKLIVPTDEFIERYWAEPDTNILSRAEFKKMFPLLAYEGEFKIEKLSSEKSVYSKQHSTEGTLELALKDIGVKSPGIYKIVVKDIDNTDKNESVEIFVEILNDKNPKVFNNEVLLNAKTFEGKPGDVLDISLVSPMKILGSLGVYRTGDRLDICPVEVDGSHNFTVSIDETDRGGIDIHFFGIKNNRSFHASQRIDVPWSNRKLMVSVDYFRDLAEPGAEEEYTIKVKNLNGENVDGQLLASMYDASLDQFIGHSWNLEFSPGLKYRYNFSPLSFTSVNLYGRNLFQRSFVKNDVLMYNNSISFKYNINIGRWNRNVLYRNEYYIDGVRSAPMATQQVSESAGMDQDMERRSKNEMEVSIDDLSSSPHSESVTIRENLNELVFFYPDVEVKNGQATLKYKNNEALTEWKLQLLAIDKDLGLGYSVHTVKTQKDLMVFPNWPRFLRQGDTLVFESRVNNLSEKAVNAEVYLEGSDFVNGNRFLNFLVPGQAMQKVTIEAGGYALVKWEVYVPLNQLNPIEFVVKAVGLEQSDAERTVLPVLTNRVLITETMQLPLKSGEQRSFDFTKFKDYFNNQGSKENVSYTLEYTANPAWLAVQALPYLEEQKYNSTTSIFHRLYANALAKTIVDKKSQIKKVFDQWKLQGSDALVSNLSKNEELKNILLEETPWVMAAKSETEQKLNIARLFEFNTMSYELEQSLIKLKQIQHSDGGFPWFEEPRSNWYISQSLLSGFIHLHHLGAINIQSAEYREMIKKLVGYIDRMVIEHYEKINREVEKKNSKWESNHLSSIIIHYLYTRNSYSALVKDGFKGKEYQFFFDQTKTHWLKQSLFDQALIALATVHKNGKNDALVKDILKSLKEKAFKDEDLGIYWAKMSGIYWNQSALSLQALMIELFVLCEDASLIDGAITWLIKNKQTNQWKNSASTVEAIYALLLSGPDMLTTDVHPEIKIGTETLNTSSNVEAGTGYIKQNWTASDINAQLGDVTIKNNQKHIAWGALYWQYFEDIDKVDSSTDGPLKIERKLFKKVKTSTGEQLIELKNGQLSKGDEVVVRLTIMVDRPMEFVHIKDQRASAFEPIDVLSAYKYSGGLGYYHVTKDISSSFFVSMMNRGTYVLEYSAKVFQDGSYSTGMTTIESMYAPDFKSHSEGSRYSN